MYGTYYSVNLHCMHKLDYRILHNHLYSPYDMDKLNLLLLYIK